MSYTRADLINQTLDFLGVLAAGQVPSSEDTEKVDKAVDASMEDLNARGVIYISDYGEYGPSGGDIDAATYLWLAMVVADNVKAGFGLAADPALTVERTRAEEMLRIIGRPGKSRQTLQTDPILRRGLRQFPNGSSFTNGT